MISGRDKATLEQMMRVVVAMQGLLDTVLAQGDSLLDASQDGSQADKDLAAAMAAGDADDPLNPPRFSNSEPAATAARPRARIPRQEG